jgi:hypothetical protein
MKYTFDQLVEIYRRYAGLKGWYTGDDAVFDHVREWMSSSSGLVGSAIAFHDTGTDSEKHSGYDAEAVAANSPIVSRVTKVAASKYRNSDGTYRQTLLASCPVPEFLMLKRAVYDSGERNAIAVLRQDGSRLGYLSKTVAADVRYHLEKGWPYACLLRELVPARETPGDERFGKDLKEAVIVLFAALPTVTHQQLRDYCKAWVSCRTNDVFVIQEKAKPPTEITEKGTCDGCGNYPRILTTIESGQKVCRTCLKEIRS